MKRMLLIFSVCLSTLLVGCSTNKTVVSPAERTVDLVKILADSRKPLFDNLIAPLDKQQPIIAASFANIDNLALSSTFGRMASEFIAAGLTERGYQVIEVKMRDSLFIKEQAGEFMLSRKLKHISRSHHAQAVLLGTYAIGGENLYVNARLVRTDDNVVLGSNDFVIPINKDIAKMLDLRGHR